MWNKRKKRKIDPKTGKREYRRKTELQRLEKKADDLTRDIIRIRDDWICQKCNTFITNKINAHRAHIVSRNNKLLRWDLINLLLLCFHCHQKYHSDDQLKEYVKTKWPARYKYLYCAPLGTEPPRCNKMLPYRTQKEKVEWMQGIIAELQDKYEELKNE